MSATISVIIPVRDGARYIAHAIESVLAQTLPSTELLVVDDGSTDDTASIVASFRDRGVRLVQQAPAGRGAARNRGVSLARGRFIAFLDADDLWTPRKLELQMAEFLKEPNLEAVHGYVRQFVSPELDPAQRARLRVPDAPVAGPGPGTMLVTRVAFDQIGDFAGAQVASEVVEWYARAIEKGLRSTMLTEVLVERRLHVANSGVVQRSLQRQDLVRILKGSIDRRRRAAAEPHATS